MADENRVLEAKLIADLDDVARIAIKRGIFRWIVGLQVRAACADMIEKNDPELVFERGRHIPPHVLVATKPVGEHHRRGAGPGGLNVVANES
jgi:hypothetical protein